jgi:hypothetical protein
VRAVPGGRTAGDDIAAALATWLGPDTARAVVRTFSDRVLGCRPDEIGPEDEARLLEALRPMLRALLGQGSVEDVLSELKRVRALSAGLDRPAVDALPAGRPGRRAG